jgi:nucleotide-binding universal stress UspA family protein
MYSRILVPVDGSPPSDRALLEAIKLATSMTSALRLVHVADEFVMDGRSQSGVYYHRLIESLIAAGRAVLEQAYATVQQYALQADLLLLETAGRRVTDHVIAQARLWPADLIVMGTHGRRGVRRLLMGSDAELVVRTSPIPVLLLRGQPQSA